MVLYRLKSYKGICTNVVPFEAKPPQLSEEALCSSDNKVKKCKE
jgi:hypothetical protein